MLKRLFFGFILIVSIFFVSTQSSYADYDSFTVNVPDSQGGYIGVVLKKSGDGYIGPRGEYYSNFPTVFQLQSVYSTNPVVQREQGLEAQADQAATAQRQEMLEQQQAIDEQMRQNTERQRAQALAQQQAEQQAQVQQIEIKQAKHLSSNLVLSRKTSFNSSSDSTGTAVIILLIFIFYFAPSIVALSRRHLNFSSILILNIFLGWTILGWIGALVWSFSHQEKK